MAFTNSIKWLKERPEGPMPALARCIVVPFKICYLTLRVLLRLILGKSKRDRMYLAGKFWLDKEYSPSFHVMRWLYRTFGMGMNKDGTHLLKIYVPKQGYVYFCRLEKGDFTPGREDDIAKLFAPKKG